MHMSDGEPRTARPVLVAIDGSSESSHTLGWAAHEAVSRRTGLRIVYACPEQLTWDPVAMAQSAPEHFRVRDQAHHILGSAEEFIGTITPRLDVRAVLRTGSPERVIRSESKRAGLTVLGRGRGHRRSVPWRLIARCSSPVSVVGLADPAIPRPAANRVVAVLLPGQGPLTVMAVLDVALATGQRRKWPVTVIADWSEVCLTGLARTILEARARVAGDVRVETRSLTGSGCALLPIEGLSTAMVVLSSPRRPRTSTASEEAFDDVLSAGSSTTFIPYADGRPRRARTR